jgi:amidohydrolase
MTFRPDPRLTREHLVNEVIDAHHDDLVRLSREIHAHPELNYEERYASNLLANALEGWGFAVERGVGDVETAFRASVGSGPPTIAFLAEYDALPDIGHGCGHNLIAISNVGAGLGAKAGLSGLNGRIQVIGTPAEEGGGGKIHLIEAGVFADVDIALSSHPSSNLTIIPTDPDNPITGLAMIGFRYAYHGKSAHAAVAPHEGINALNAVLRLFSGIDTLRQHLRDDVRIHGVITDGGKAPNVVPDFAAANFMLRSRDREYLKVVIDKVRHVAEGAALETGARLEILPYYPFPTRNGTHSMYENSRPNAVLLRIARDNADAADLVVHQPPLERGSGGASTDFGNVSQILPAAIVRFAVSDRPVPGHSLALRDAAITDLAHSNALAVAKTLALTALDLLADPALIDEVRADFSRTATTQ